MSLKREDPVCIVQCRIFPERKVRATNYPVTIKLNEEDENILSVECHGCAAGNDRIELS